MGWFILLQTDEQKQKKKKHASLRAKMRIKDRNENRHTLMERRHKIDLKRNEYSFCIFECYNLDGLLSRFNRKTKYFRRKSLVCVCVCGFFVSQYCVHSNSMIMMKLKFRFKFSHVRFCFLYAIRIHLFRPNVMSLLIQ